jgi:hypothetical protein
MGAEGELIDFPIALVHQHAVSVGRVSDAVELARSAVHDVSMDTQAYGQLCQFLPALLSPIFGMGVDALHGTVDSLHETAHKLSIAATGTGSTDTANGQRVMAAGNQSHPKLELPL